jgi:uncharacterized protein (DUF305 family)
MDAKPYGRLALMAVLHFAAMYLLMYAMVDVFGNAVPNLNQAYMAGLMTAPMLLFELALMGSMYPLKAVNFGVVAAGLLLLAGSFLAIRQQVAIGDREFLRSMIPHHAGAILMCEKAKLADVEIKTLCAGIVEGQRAEIAQMRARLKALGG